MNHRVRTAVSFMQPAEFSLRIELGHEDVMSGRSGEFLPAERRVAAGVTADIAVALLIRCYAMTGTGTLAFRRANPIHLAVGIHREAEDMSRAGMSEWLRPDGPFAHDGSGDEDVAQLVGRDAVSVVVAGSATTLEPQKLSRRVILGDEKVVVTDGPDRDLIEFGFGTLKVPGHVTVPSVIARDCVASINQVSATAADPQELSVGIDLRHEEVHRSDRRERLLAKGRRAGELTREQNVPGRIDRDAPSLIVQSPARRDRPFKRRRRFQFRRRLARCCPVRGRIQQFVQRQFLEHQM